MRIAVKMVWLGLGSVLVACGGVAPGTEESFGEATEPLVVDTPNGVDNIWQPSQQRKLTYCVSLKFDTPSLTGGTYKGEVERGIRAAFDAWEASADVRFVHLSALDATCETAAVSLSVQPIPTRGAGGGLAPFPSWTSRVLELGVGYCDAKGKNCSCDANGNCAGLSKCDLAGVCGDQNSAGTVQEWVRLIGIHEVGHALGFRHEFAHPEHVVNVTNPDCLARLKGEYWVDANGDGRLDPNLSLRAVSSYDSQSAMDYVNDSVCGGNATVTHITSSDVWGSQTLYGKPLKDIDLNLGVGVTVVGQPALSSWGPNRLDAFVRGSDNRLHHNWFDGAWHTWEIVGGTITSSPGAVSWGDGRIDIFARGSTGDLHHVFYGVDFGWLSESLGKPTGTNVSTSEVAVTSWGVNRLDVFVRGENNKLYQTWFTNSWRGWTDLGGTLSAGPGAVAWGYNRIDIYVRDSNGGLKTKWWDEAGWHNFATMTTPAGKTIANVAPTVASMRSGRLDLFVRSSTGSVHHEYFDNGWSNSWELVSKTVNNNVAVRSWGNGRIDLVGIGSTDVLVGGNLQPQSFMRHGFFNGSLWVK